MSSILTQLDALFKDVYANKVENLTLECSKISDKVKFSESEKIGDEYVQTVKVANSGGFSYGNRSMGAYPLRKSRGLITKRAIVGDESLVLRQAMSYSDLAGTVSDKQAFVKATSIVVEDMLESTTKRNEIKYLYGGRGIGNFNAQTASGANLVLTATAGEFSSGIWGGSEGTAELEFFSSNGAKVGSSDPDSTFVVESVDSDLRQITVSGTTTGIAALVSAISNGAVDAYYCGTYGIEGIGLQAIASTVGNLFGIDNSVYSLFRGNTATIDAGGLTVGKMLKAISKAVNKGLDETTTIYLNPLTWNSLASDLTSIRTLDSSYKNTKVEIGSSAISIYSSAGETSIEPHLFVKEADMFCAPLSRLKRIGESDTTFKLEGSNDRFFNQLQDQAGVELRLYSAQSMFTAFPAKLLFAKIAQA